MTRFINPLFVNSCIDSNIVHHMAAESWEPIRRILELYIENKIQLIIPHSVRTELLSPKTPARVRAAVQDLIFTKTVGLTVEERKERDRLIKLARGNAKLENIAADLLHVAESVKYGGYFITLDKRLLNRAVVISDVIGIEVVTPENFMERVAEAQKGLDQERI
jgi:predicted nucleic acid-binding protein